MALQRALGVPMTHVPYKGMQPAINDVAGGHIPFMFSPIPFAHPARAGRQAAHARRHHRAARRRRIPDVPPLAELGFKDFDAVSWFMLAAPASTPQPIIDKLHRELRTIIDDAGVRQEFVRLGLLPVPSFPPAAELKPFVQSEIVRWAEIVKKAGLRPRAALATRPCLRGRAPLDRARVSAPRAGSGEVAEWSIAPHSKCGIRATVSGVRIPPSPPVPLKTDFSAARAAAFNRWHCAFLVETSVLIGRRLVPKSLSDRRFSPDLSTCGRKY